MWSGPPSGRRRGKPQIVAECQEQPKREVLCAFSHCPMSQEGGCRVQMLASDSADCAVVSVCGCLGENKAAGGGKFPWNSWWPPFQAGESH
mmetsp:Transcript_23405/g.58740  ORF Transcript_23405/g.58740 Transcript_23405/m.58740 type:complete len:91 (-) Transcript_23405:128-400(-)